MAMLERSHGLAIGLSLFVVALVYQRYSRPKLRLPPGPPPTPFIGNAKQMPRTQAWKTFQEWGRVYGPVVYLHIFTRQYVILNTAKAVSDLLVKRSDIYSDRPRNVMYQELVGRKYTVFAVSSEHPRFKKYRKTLSSGLNNRAIQDYHDVMRSETRTFLHQLVAAPESFVDHIRRNAGAIIMKIAYGYTVTSDDDYFVQLMKLAFDLGSQAQAPGRWLVDYFPILRYVPSWFPGAGFKRQAKEWHDILDQPSAVPYEWVKKQMASGNYVESFASQMISGASEEALKDPEEVDIIKCLAGGLYAGGADTTVSALTTFFLVMCLYPDIQRRAQAEIDDKVGRGRLPSFEDRDSLVYVEALMKEILRWAPVAPLGIPHAVVKDDVYENHHIPAGATVISNVWAIMHDEAIYPDPSRFDPERFLQTDNHESQVDPYSFAFGFGRRICPGMYFAQNSLFLTISSVLSTFDIGKARDHLTGKEVQPEAAFTNGITMHPVPFKCRITLRADASTLI